MDEEIEMKENIRLKDYVDCNHNKVYKNVIYDTYPPRHDWICSKCGEKGCEIIKEHPILNYENVCEHFEKPKTLYSRKTNIACIKHQQGSVFSEEITYSPGFFESDVKAALKEFIINSSMINNNEYKELAEKTFGKELIE